MTVVAAEPATVRATILSRLVEVNGRPVSYLLLEDDAEDLEPGRRMQVGVELLSRTVNSWLLGVGAAYSTFYTSQPRQHRDQLLTVAAMAREARAGVWARDESRRFAVAGPDPLGPSGALILPKLFRRASDYRADVARGFSGTLPQWLVAASIPPRDEDDVVVLPSGARIALSDLLHQTGDEVELTADLLDLVFVEKVWTFRGAVSREEPTVGTRAAAPG
jgi:hypothetical protein